MPSLVEYVDNNRPGAICRGYTLTVQGPGGRTRTRRWTETSTTTTFQDTVTETFRTGVDIRSGQRTVITERFDNTSQ